MIYEIKDLTFSYSADDRKILNKAKLKIEEGQILSILGPNGAGKTTLLDCMAGLLNPESGTIELCGQDISKMKPKDIAGIAAYVPQLHTPAFDYTVLDFVLMGCSHKYSSFGKPGREDELLCMDILSSMDLEELANKSYMKISGGERQQVLIARALAQEPRVVLFDEPIAHLDYGNQQRVLKRIVEMSERGISVVITTHNPDHALLLGGQTAVVGRDGNIVQGRTEEIVTEERLKEIYNMELYVMWLEELGRRTCLVPKL